MEVLRTVIPPKEDVLASLSEKSPGGGKKSYRMILRTRLSD